MNMIYPWNPATYVEIIVLNIDYDIKLPMDICLDNLCYLSIWCMIKT